MIDHAGEVGLSERSSQIPFLKMTWLRRLEKGFNRYWSLSDLIGEVGEGFRSGLLKNHRSSWSFFQNVFKNDRFGRAGCSGLIYTRWPGLKGRRSFFLPLLNDCFLNFVYWKIELDLWWSLRSYIPIAPIVVLCIWNTASRNWLLILAQFSSCERACSKNRKKNPKIY